MSNKIFVSSVLLVYVDTELNSSVDGEIKKKPRRIDPKKYQPNMWIALLIFIFLSLLVVEMVIAYKIL